MRKPWILAAMCVAMAAWGLNVTAQDDKPSKKKKGGKIAQKLQLEGLMNPCGLAIQPGTGDVFVSDTANGKIVKVLAKGGDAVDVITGLPHEDIYGKGPMYKVGPMGLAFIGPNMLAVGDGGLPDGSEMVRIFELPKDGKALKSDDAKYKLGPVGPGEASAKGEGNFYGLVATAKGIYITSNGDDTKGWILRIPLKDGAPGKLEPFIATKPLLEVDAPVGITLDKNGNLIVGQMGEVNKPKDSLLTAYDESGKLLWKAETGLYDIAALAYSPKTGKLYAADFAWMEAKEGGIYELTVTGSGDKTEVKATKVISLDRPTTLAFNSNGDLYVTVFGTKGGKEGALLKISGL